MVGVRIYGVVMALLMSTGAMAKGQKFIALNLGLNYEQSSVASDSGDQTASKTVVNFHAGFFPFEGLIVGLRHFQIGRSASVTNIDSTTETTTTTATATQQGQGLHIGYYAENGFIIGAAYLLNPTYKTKGIEYYGGGALVADLGWCWTWNDFGFGAQLTYSSFVYKKSKINGEVSSFTKDEQWVDVLPMGFAAIFF